MKISGFLKRLTGALQMDIKPPYSLKELTKSCALKISGDKNESIDL